MHGKKQAVPVRERIRQVLIKAYLYTVESVITNCFYHFAGNPPFSPAICGEHGHQVAATAERTGHFVSHPWGATISQGGIEIRNDKGDPHGGMIAHYETVAFGFDVVIRANPEEQCERHLGVRVRDEIR